MPIINVQYEEGALAAADKAALAERLTELLLAMEGGAKTAGGRAFATVVFTPLQPGNWWVGGRSDNEFVAPPGKFLVHVTIPEGYMNTAHKNEVHAGVKTAIVGVLGDNADPRQGASILVMIDEVTEGNWSARGEPISIASIAAAVGLPKDGVRFAWVRGYFGAKARQYAAAGYPKDTGGLLSAEQASTSPIPLTTNVRKGFVAQGDSRPPLVAQKHAPAHPDPAGLRRTTSDSKAIVGEGRPSPSRT